ncbi:tripartite motif-containing protein 16-like [Gouania willdenowi]|uniref:tripartite motif-containing protein 16-like n=1 Tax=Gouania willdenowi TaxID=441366 RepID=UPI0010559EBA|nr:tripartite motif-containing protein 16-like [Gouania willdenowi]
MAQEGADLYGETFSCSICLNLLKEPVTVPCGHSYCRTCISSFWDGEAVKNSYSCPQCREAFTPRPVLVKNTMLAEVVEKINKSRRHDAPAVESYATAEDVACDSCTGRKLKAYKSCLVCLASFCKKHLQPHYESAAFKRHKLVDPSEKLQEMICSRHDEVMKIFCRTDQQCICFLCSMDEHKGHDTVSAAAERTEKQRELQESRADIQKNIQDREEDVELLKQQVKTINVSADQTVEHNEQMFTELIRLLQDRRSELKKEVRSKQQTEVSAVRALQEKLEQEISELKKRDAELQQLSHTEDHIQFVLSYSSLSALSVSTHSSIITGPENCFEEVTAAVSELREHLHKVLMEDWTKVCHTVERVDVLQQPEPTSRAGFLKYSQEITLDPNTAFIQLSLSEGNRKVTLMRENQDHPPHPDRFTLWQQVLSRESVTGRCYWEVEWRGREVYVAVSYKSISRAWIGHECGLGFNNKSWSLNCTTNKYIFNHNNIRTTVPGPHSSRIGVYVDHTAGILSFYSVCDTMTLLHRVNTTFTEPLHLGLCVWNVGDTAELCKL